ncbi:cytidine deaminase|uniref:Cytidine deaminase n=1 Tax=Leuconostoc lactis TaxID=1246 RepID=A0A6L7AE02_LEULA|nr:cytidine deaminase [Leuconostoc lactis]
MKAALDETYTPYSHFPVGAALLTASGTVFKGINIENVSFGLTNCAERTAIFSAMAAGHRQFAGLVVAGLQADYLKEAFGVFEKRLDQLTDLLVHK